MLIGIHHHVNKGKVGIFRVRRTLDALAEGRHLQLLPGVVAQHGQGFLVGRRLHLHGHVVGIDLYGLDLRLEFRQIGVLHRFSDLRPQTGGFRHGNLQRIIGDAPLLTGNAADHPGTDMFRGFRQVHHPQPHQGGLRLGIIARFVHVEAETHPHGFCRPGFIEVYLADVPDAQRLLFDSGAVGHAHIGYHVAAGAQGGYQFHAPAGDIALHWRGRRALRPVLGGVLGVFFDLLRVGDAQVGPGRLPQAQAHGPRGDRQHRCQGGGDQQAPLPDMGPAPFVFIGFHQKLLLHAVHGGEEQLFIFHNTSSFSRWTFSCLRRRKSMERTVGSRMPVFRAISVAEYRCQ